MRLPWKKADATATTNTVNQPSIVTAPVASGDYAMEKESGATEKATTVTASENGAALQSETKPDQAVVDEKSSRSLDEAATEAEVEGDTIKVDSANALEKTTTAATTSSELSEGPEDESKYPHGLQLALLVLGLCLGNFVVALDNTIIATAIPHITTVFDSLNDIGWYGSAYLLTTASLQPSLGKVYTFFNVKLTYVSAIAVFELGSVLCGAATSSKMLIVGRAVAGAGASGIFSGGMTIIAFAAPLRQRATYIAAISSMFGISSIVGPILGGVLTDRVSWRWCFYINLPIGALCTFTVLSFFKNPDRRESKFTFKEKILELDLLGAALLIASVVCLLLALQWGGSTYPWSASRVYGCFIGFGLIISIFAFTQFQRGDRATLPPRVLLKQRTVLASALFSFLLALGLYVIVYYIPVWFQSVRNLSAEDSGIRTIPFMLSSILAAVPIGIAVGKVGYYTPFIWVGSALFPVGAGMLSLLKVNSGAGAWIGYQILAGVSAGMCVQLPFVAVQAVLNKRDLPTGNAIAVFFNTMGGAIGVAIAENVFSNGLVTEIPKHAPTANVKAIVEAGATHFREVVSKAELPGVLLAYNISVTHTFIAGIAASGVAFLTSFLFEMKSVKGKAITAGGAA